MASEREVGITADDLGQALAEIPVDIDNRTPGAPVFIGWLRNPVDLAERALAILDSSPPPARHEPDLCAACGNQFLPGQVCNDCEWGPLRAALKQPPVPLPMPDDAPEPDAELAALDVILDVLASLDDPAAIERVLAYTIHRFGT